MGWLGLAGIGAVAGLYLGQLTVGSEAGRVGDPVSYAEMTGNPGALQVDSQPADPCYDCDSHGGGVRLQDAREERMDGAFRELGAVAIDYSPGSDQDYRYGGRFDDPDAAVHAAAAQIPETALAIAPTAEAPVNAEPNPDLVPLASQGPDQAESESESVADR